MEIVSIEPTYFASLSRYTILEVTPLLFDVYGEVSGLLCRPVAAILSMPIGQAFTSSLGSLA
jgi:hypothetical protein